MEIKKTYKQKVCIRPFKREDTTKSGIIIPTSIKDKLIKAEIVKISKLLEDEGEIKVGDKVLVPEVAGIILEEEGLILINDYDIVSFLE